MCVSCSKHWIIFLDLYNSHAAPGARWPRPMCGPEMACFVAASGPAKQARCSDVIHLKLAHSTPWILAIGGGHLMFLSMSSIGPAPHRKSTFVLTHVLNSILGMSFENKQPIFPYILCMQNGPRLNRKLVSRIG